MNTAYLHKLIRDNDNIRIALIATYPRMAENMAQLVRDTSISFTNVNAHFDDAVRKAQDLENDVDVILSRGGTAAFIKNVVSVPVVVIHISPYDLTMSVSSLPEDVHRVGFVNYERPIFGADEVASLFGKEILQYTFTDLNSLQHAFDAAKHDRCEVVLGGASGCSYGNSIGLNCVEIISGKESIYQALISAIELIHIQREEKKQAVRLKAAFDALQEGIAINDENGKYTLFNRAGLELFHINPKEIESNTLTSLPIGDKCIASFNEKQENTDYLQDIYNKTINTCHLPIFNNGDFIGQVNTFEDVTKIQLLEGNIRHQLNKRGFSAKYTFSDIIGKSPAICNIKEQAELFSKLDVSILINGESGTGKELFAHSIHQNSIRKTGPFIAVNCAAIPENLLESELFGYAPGAFTGARKDGKPGLFEMAHNGTIFLDEIAEIPVYLQARLLRILQEKEVLRIGDDKIIPVDCRIISATNKDLNSLVEKGDFREDLYYRLNILNIYIPPLRSRKEDIPLIAEHFFDLNGLPEYKKKEALMILRDFDTYYWPGNIRELNNLCFRIIALLGTDSPLDAMTILRNINLADGNNEMITMRIDSHLTLKEAVIASEKQYISKILRRNNNNQTVTAKQLDIGRTTLWRKMQELEQSKTTDSK